MANTDQIEENGVTIIRNFLFNSKTLKQYINEGDKEPTWDGSIYVYKDDNHKVENLKGRVPVQLKTSSVGYDASKKKISFWLEKKHLQNYLGEGGTVLLRPVYLDLSTFSLFICLLLPSDLSLLLSDDKGPDYDIKLELKKVKDVHDLENLLSFYLDNRKLQGTVFQKDIIRDVAQPAEFFVSGIKDKYSLDAMVSDFSYIYVKDPHSDMLLPTSLRFNEISVEKPLSISIDDKTYFESAHHVIRKGNEEYILLNSTLKLLVSDQELKFEYFEDEKSTIFDIVNSVEFIMKLADGNRFILMGREVVGNASQNDLNIDDDKYQFWKELCNTLDKNGIDPRRITSKYYDDNPENINLIIHLFRNGGTITPHGVDESNQVLIRHFAISDDEIVIVFRKTDSGDYSGMNILSDEINTENFPLMIADNKVVLSRFIILPSIFGEKDKGRFVWYLVKNEEYILKNIFNEYVIGAVDHYVMFLLDILKGFDLCNDEKFLDIADKVSFFLLDKHDSNERIYDVIRFNLLQTKKRREPLNDEDIDILDEMSQKHKDDISFQCCIEILLESRKVSSIFKRLTNDEKKAIKTWPIWALKK